MPPRTQNVPSAPSTQDVAPTLLPPAATDRPLAETLSPQTMVPSDGMAVSASQPAAKSEVAVGGVAGYEMLEMIGRGGMGVVYKARQINADRLVALKMILAGTHADEEAITRFRTEAQAVARLQHPHVVQVYEVGEHAGQPFFSLEFCSGGSLEKKLGGIPIRGVEAAALVEKLALAMQAAHDAHIIHRDLKPDNVLLSADGTPKIADFGLAKRLTDVGQTQSGAVMGTPSYMAPEQAGGKKDIGPACDIYSLGAILYNCLTGRPPFRAATVMDTLIQVVNEEPVSPRALNAEVSIDLETICLKCLQKEPGKRYGSARELAEDLRRFQRGEPIAARPVGRVERGWRWCRRNPALAAMTAAALLLLAVGTTVSSVLALLADQRADEATVARDKARTKEQEAVASQLATDRANESLRESRGRLATSVARGMLRPLAEYGKGGMLADTEIDALWELTTTTEEVIRRKFMEIALESPMASSQLRGRAAVAMHATAGLDYLRRGAIERLFINESVKERQSPELQITLGIALAGLEGSSSVAVAHVIIRALSKSNDVDEINVLAEGLSTVAVRLELKEVKELAATLLLTLSKTTSPLAIFNPVNSSLNRALARGLSAAATRLEPKEAAAMLIQSINKNTLDHSIASPLAVGLLGIAARLEPKELTAMLTDAMNRIPVDFSLGALAEGLLVTAPRLDPMEAKELAAALLQTMRKTVGISNLSALAVGLAAVSARLDSKEAAVVCSKAATIIAQSISSDTHADTLIYLAEGLSAVSARLDSKEAAAICSKAATAFTRVMSEASDDKPLNEYIFGSLIAVAARLEAKEATTLLIQALSKTSDDNALRAITGNLLAAAARLEPKDAVNVLSKARSNTFDVGIMNAFAGAMLDATARLDPSEAREMTIALLRNIKMAADDNAIGPWAEDLSTVAARLDPKEAAAVCSQAATILTQALSKIKPSGSLSDLATSSLAKGLSAVAARMDPKEASEVCFQVATTLVDAMRIDKPTNAGKALAEGVSVVAARLKPKEAKELVALLTKAINTISDDKTLGDNTPRLGLPANPLKNFNALRDYALVLAAVSTLDPEESEVVFSRAASALVKAMTRTSDAAALSVLAEGMATVAARLTPKNAMKVYSQAADVLTQAMSKTLDENALSLLAWELSSISTRRDPMTAAATLIYSMSKITDAKELKNLAGHLSSVLCNQMELGIRKCAIIVYAIGQPPQSLGVLSLLPTLNDNQRPIPCRFSTAELVELLKHPLCVGQARRVILDRLEDRYQRRFVDQWDFVRYAEANKLGLDFRTPPRRPDTPTR